MIRTAIRRPTPPVRRLPYPADMALIEMQDGNFVAVHEPAELVQTRLAAADLLAVFSGTNGALAPISPACVVDVR